MLFDGHTHTWAHWPYPGVPDPEHRGSAATVLREMDSNDVERAVIVCARIDHNEDNNDYAARQVALHPDRMVMFADLESFWTPEHRTPGASQRLREAAERYGLRGFVHYLPEIEDGWLDGGEGQEFFGTAAELGLVASLAAKPAWQPGLRRIARLFPSLRILVHHLGDTRPTLEGFDRDLALVEANGDLPNLFLKVSGFPRMSVRRWGFPYDDAVENVLRPLLSAYGPERLVWASDWPYVRDDMTYRQALSTVRDADLGLSPEQHAGVMGLNLARLLA